MSDVRKIIDLDRLSRFKDDMDQEIAGQTPAISGNKLTIGSLATPIAQDIVNVNDINGVPTTAYGSAAAARAAVDASSGLRIQGQIITYLLADGWYTDQYIGSATDSTSWGTASNWKTLGPVSVSQNTSTNPKDAEVLTIGPNEYDIRDADAQTKINTIAENLSDIRSFTWNVQSDTQIAGVYPDVTVKLLGGVTYIVDVVSATGWFYITWVENGVTKTQNLHPTDANHKAITPTVDVDAIKIKSDVGEINKISIYPEKNLYDIVQEQGEAIEEQKEALDSINDSTTTYTYVASVDHNFVLDIKKGQIIIFNLTKADGTNKFIEFRPYDSSGEIPTPYPKVNLNVPYTYVADKNYNGFKAAYNGNTGEAILSYTVLGAISMLEETKQDKIHDVVLYAYADGNPSSDTTNKFYGWDGTKSPIQRAIDSVPNGASYKTTIFCKGNFKATAVSMLDDQEPSFKNVVYISPDKSNIELVGEGIDITFVELDLPSNLEIDYRYVQTMSIVGNNCIVKGMTVTAKNCRYPIHIDKSASDICNGYDISLIDVKLVHYANDSGVSTMDSPCGFGISSGMKLLTERCEFVRYNGSAPLYTHDNSNYDEGFVWTIKNCKAVAVTDTASTFMHFITFQVMNSGVRNVVNIEGVDFGSSKPLIDMDYNADSDNPEPYYKVVANTSMPIGVENRFCKKRVLKVQSKSTGSSSSVRFSTSSGFNALAKGTNTASYTDEFGFTHIDGYKYKDGALNYHGFALGGLSLDIDSEHDMAARLGDCTGSSKVVALVIDGVNKYVVFDSDYTNYTDEQILAIFDDAIGDVADVTLYNICSENFPSGNGLTMQRNACGDNNGTDEVILKGMGVHFVKNVNGINKQGIVKATTNAEVDGIAIDDIKPNDYGRVMRFGLLSIWENKDNLYLKLDNPPSDPNDPYRPNWNGKFSIGPTPGIFTKDDNNGIISVDMTGWFTISLGNHGAL